MHLLPLPVEIPLKTLSLAMLGLVVYVGLLARDFALDGWALLTSDDPFGAYRSGEYAG